MEKGATHYAHVFYPLTGLTAEKHDSFLEPGGDGSAIAEFAGKTLIQGEPDASSFPNGGLRDTFEARGYTGWDVTSPAYILENPNGNTLCIPTVFVSMTGEALDHKTPLLRSQQAMAAQAERVLKLFGHDEPDARRVVRRRRAGVLPDRPAASSSPAPTCSTPAARCSAPSRRRARSSTTTTSAPSPSACSASCSTPSASCSSSASRPRPGTTRSRPGQFEIAPMFERANVAADHQQLLMVDVQDGRPEARHGVPLPREAVRRASTARASTSTSRSATPTEGNLLAARATPRTTTRSSSCSAPRSIRAVHKFGGLLRASVASATQRPPARRQRGAAGDHLDLPRRPAHRRVRPDRQGRRHVARRRRARCIIGVDTLPVLPTDPGRPQPHEPVRVHRQPLRVPRARARCRSIAGPMVTINTILAEALDYIATELESLVADGTDFNVAVQKVLEEIITDHGAVVFNGDGYSDDWQIEAEARGPAEPAHDARRAARARSPTRRWSCSPRTACSTTARCTAATRSRLEQYALSIGVEARLTLEMAHDGHPAGGRRATRPSWRTNVASLKAAGVEADTADARRGVRRRSPSCGRRSPACRPRSRPTRGDDRWPRPSTPATSCCRRWPRCAPRPTRSRAGRRRPLAAADLPGDALHPLIGGRM